MSFLAGAGSALLGGALSGISNLFGASSQNKNVDKQINAAKEEAEKTRNWQTSEREAQQEWNYNMWLANNQYNAPMAQMQRYKDAGLNPDLMYSGGNVQSPGTPATGGHTPSGVVADTSGYNRYRPLGDVASKALNDAATAALTAKTSTETEGQEHTNDILASDASFRNAFNRGQLDTIQSSILVNNSKIQLNDSQASQARAMVQQIDANISKIDSEIDLLISQAADVDDRVWERHVRVALDSFIEHGKLKVLQGQLGVSQEQLKNATIELMTKLPLMKSEEKRNQAMSSYFNDLGLKANSEQSRILFDLSQDMNWDDLDRTMNHINEVLRTLSGFVPFANPAAPKSGKIHSKVTTRSKDGKTTFEDYDYYD